jgi:hypothetical protein
MLLLVLVLQLLKSDVDSFQGVLFIYYSCTADSLLYLYLLSTTDACFQGEYCSIKMADCRECKYLPVVYKIGYFHYLLTNFDEIN